MLRTPPNDENVKPLWKGPYLEETIPLDPWNHPYQYSVPGNDGDPFALYSLGADGQPGGVDDNADWLFATAIKSSDFFPQFWYKSKQYR